VASSADVISCPAGGEASRSERSEKPSDEAVATAPLRIDLTGGFTDIPPFSQSVEALHINAAFDLAVKVVCRKRADRRIEVNFEHDSASPATSMGTGRRRFLDAMRKAVGIFADDCGLELTISSDAPAGSGLGSSGAILVAAVGGCATITGRAVSRTWIAERAIHAARAAGILGGRQDEFAAAHGSLRAYIFRPTGRAEILPLATQQICRELHERFLVVQMETSGRRIDVVAEVVAAVRAGRSDTLEALHRLKDLARVLLEHIRTARFEAIAPLLQQIREAQNAVHEDICCPTAAATMSQVCRDIPGLQYKILGGGGAGSCLLVHVSPEYKNAAEFLIRRHATKVFHPRVQSVGVTTEFARVQAPR
jgi:D-glycero-alpha-D-manno-heptose-7-phosphate kinase